MIPQKTMIFSGNFVFVVRIIYWYTCSIKVFQDRFYIVSGPIDNKLITKFKTKDGNSLEKGGKASREIFPTKNWNYCDCSGMFRSWSAFRTWLSFATATTSTSGSRARRRWWHSVRSTPSEACTPCCRDQTVIIFFDF